MVGKCEHWHSSSPVQWWAPRVMSGLARGTLPSFVEAKMNTHSGQGPLLPPENMYVYINACILKEEVARMIVVVCLCHASAP